MSIRSTRSVQRGFTLIEVMIAVVIVGILAAIAYPSYMDHVRRSHEAEAIGQILSLASKLEAYRSKKFTYAGATVATLAPEAAKNSNYTISLVLNDGNQSYTITGSPASSLMSGMDILEYDSTGIQSWD